MGGIQNRKLYVAALALALGVLVLDKTVFRGGLSPGSAQASDLLVDPSAPQPIAASPAAVSSENTAEIALQLERARERLGLDPAQVPDAFFGAGLGEKPVERASDLSPADRFRRKYTLHAVIAGRTETGQETGVALLETRDEKGAVCKVRLSIGQTSEDGWTLTAVDTQSHSRAATFECNGYTVVLTLPSPKSDASDSKAQDENAAGR